MRPLPHQFLSPHPLRVSLHHERLADDQAGAVTDRDQLPRLGRMRPIGFSQKHVLAGLESGTCRWLGTGL
jgi:hypothetical protein